MPLLILDIEQNLILELRLVFYLGYPYGFKGYKLYDLATKSCFVSMDVVFHESTFPFKHRLPKLNKPVSSALFPPQPIFLEPNPLEFADSLLQNLQ